MSHVAVKPEVEMAPLFEKPGAERNRIRRRKTVRKHRRRDQVATCALEHLHNAACDAHADVDPRTLHVETNGAKPTLNRKVLETAAKARRLAKRAH